MSDNYLTEDMLKVLRAWQKKQQAKVDKLDEDYETPMELDTD